MMADIVLAEFSGRAWLVRGEQHIDDLLANTLPTDVSIEVVACESKSEVGHLWCQYGGAADAADELWLIHPAIVARARGQSGEMHVIFAEWSASLDAAALAIVETASGKASARPECILTLVRYLAADGPAMAADLANLRTGLLEARLASGGVPTDRIVRETQAIPHDGYQDRIDLVIRPA